MTTTERRVRHAGLQRLANHVLGKIDRELSTRRSQTVSISLVAANSTAVDLLLLPGDVLGKCLAVGSVAACGFAVCRVWAETAQEVSAQRSVFWEAMRRIGELYESATEQVA